MQNLSPRTQVIIGCGLALLMAATRVPYLPGTAALFGASWAVFFLAGFYLRSVLAVPALLALAVVLDGIALGWSGVRSWMHTHQALFHLNFQTFQLMLLKSFLFPCFLLRFKVRYEQWDASKGSSLFAS